MKHWEIIIESPASTDIDEAHDWIADRDKEAADRWFEASMTRLLRFKAFQNVVRWHLRINSLLLKYGNFCTDVGSTRIAFFLLSLEAGFTSCMFGMVPVYG